MSTFLVIILITRAQATGYELSIYTKVNPFAWIFLIGSICGGISIIVHSALGKNGKWWTVGLIIVMLNNFIILSLPALRGYFIYNSQDPLSHFRITNDILVTGHIGEENFYPILHILLSDISLLSNISPIVIVRYFPSFISLLYTIYIYILARSLFQDRGRVILALASATTLLSGYLNVSTYPEGLGFFTLPLIFYLYFKMSKSDFTGYRIIFITSLWVYPFIHPRSSLMIIGFLISMEIGKMIYRYGGVNSLASLLNRVSWKPILMSIIALFSWLSVFSYFGTRIRGAYEILTSEIAVVNDPHVMAVTNSVQLGRMDIIEFVIKMAGHIVIYALISIISVLIIIKLFLRKNKEPRNEYLENLILLITWVVIGEVIMAIMFISIRTTVLTRVVSTDILISLSPIFVGFGLYEFYKRFNKPRYLKIVCTAIIFIIVLSSSIAIFSLYRSPYVFQINWHVTHMDVDGIGWLVDNKVPELLYFGLGVPSNLQSSVLTSNNYNREDLVESKKEIAQSEIISSHFGYGEFANLGEQHNKDYYMIITRRFKSINEDSELRKRRVVTNRDLARWDFDDNDFVKLDLDGTVEQIYANGEFDIFLVKKYDVIEQIYKYTKKDYK